MGSSGAGAVPEKQKKGFFKNLLGRNRKDKSGRSSKQQQQQQAKETQQQAKPGRRNKHTARSPSPKLGRPQNAKPGDSYMSTPHSAEIIVRKKDGKNAKAKEEDAGADTSADNRDVVEEMTDRGEISNLPESPATAAADDNARLRVDVDDMKEEPKHDVEIMESFSSPKFEDTVPSSLPMNGQTGVDDDDDVSAVTDPTFSNHHQQRQRQQQQHPQKQKQQPREDYAPGRQSGRANMAALPENGGDAFQFWDGSPPAGQTGVDPFKDPFFEPQYGFEEQVSYEVDSDKYQSPKDQYRTDRAGTTTPLDSKHVLTDSDREKVAMRQQQQQQQLEMEMERQEKTLREKARREMERQEKARQDKARQTLELQELERQKLERREGANKRKEDPELKEKEIQLDDSVDVSVLTMTSPTRGSSSAGVVAPVEVPDPPLLVVEEEDEDDDDDDDNNYIANEGEGDNGPDFARGGNTNNSKSKIPPAGVHPPTIRRQKSEDPPVEQRTNGPPVDPLEQEMMDHFFRPSVRAEDLHSVQEQQQKQQQQRQEQQQQDEIEQQQQQQQQQKQEQHQFHLQHIQQQQQQQQQQQWQIRTVRSDPMSTEEMAAKPEPSPQGGPLDDEPGPILSLSRPRQLSVFREQDGVQTGEEPGYPYQNHIHGGNTPQLEPSVAGSPQFTAASRSFELESPRYQNQPTSPLTHSVVSHSFDASDKLTRSARTFDVSESYRQPIGSGKMSPRSSPAKKNASMSVMTSKATKFMRKHNSSRAHSNSPTVTELNNYQEQSLYGQSQQTLSSKTSRQQFQMQGKANRQRADIGKPKSQEEEQEQQQQQQRQQQRQQQLQHLQKQLRQRQTSSSPTSMVVSARGLQSLLSPTPSPTPVDSQPPTARPYIQTEGFMSKFMKQGRKPRSVSQRTTPIVIESSDEPSLDSILGPILSGRGSPRKTSNRKQMAPIDEPYDLHAGKRSSAPIAITSDLVAMGLSAKSKKRVQLIASGLVSPKVLPEPSTKSKKPTSSVAEVDTSNMDPIQLAGYKLLSKAAIPIQTAVRRYLAEREAVDRMWALIEMQSYFRRWRAEAFVYAHRNSAVKIQAAFRGWKARDSIDEAHFCATEIQRIVRGHLAAVMVYEHFYRVMVIQGLVRGMFGRKAAADRLQKVIQIQSAARGFLARFDQDCQHGAATTIQAQFRSYSAQLQFQFNVVDIIIVQSIARRWHAKRTHRYLKGVVTVQSATRGWLWRRHQEQKEQECAVKIQTVWRGFLSYTNYVFMLGDILLVQCVMRQWLARRRLAEKKREWAATIVQRNWRRYTCQMLVLYKLVHVIIVQSVARRRLAILRVRRMRLDVWAAYRIQKFWKVQQWKKQRRCEDAAVQIQAGWRRFWAYSHFIIVNFEVIRIQAVIRGFLARNESRLHLGCAIVLQAVVRRYLAVKAVERHKLVHALIRGTSVGLRDNSAARRIQRAWRVVLRRRLEKEKALVIERFFIMVKREVEREIRRQKRKKQSKKDKRRRQKKEADEQLLERVWLNTMDEDDKNLQISKSTRTPRSKSAHRSRNKSRPRGRSKSRPRGSTAAAASVAVGTPPTGTVAKASVHGSQYLSQTARPRPEEEDIDLPAVAVNVRHADDLSEVTSPSVFNRNTLGITITTRDIHPKDMDDNLSLEEAWIDTEVQQAKEQKAMNDAYVQRHGLQNHGTYRDSSSLTARESPRETAPMPTMTPRSMLAVKSPREDNSLSVQHQASPRTRLEARAPTTRSFLLSAPVPKTEKQPEKQNQETLESKLSPRPKAQVTVRTVSDPPDHFLDAQSSVGFEPKSPHPQQQQEQRREHKQKHHQHHQQQQQQQLKAVSAVDSTTGTHLDRPKSPHRAQVHRPSYMVNTRSMPQEQQRQQYEPKSPRAPSMQQLDTVQHSNSTPQQSFVHQRHQVLQSQPPSPQQQQQQYPRSPPRGRSQHMLQQSQSQQSQSQQQPQSQQSMGYGSSPSRSPSQIPMRTPRSMSPAPNLPPQQSSSGGGTLGSRIPQPHLDPRYHPSSGLDSSSNRGLPPPQPQQYQSHQQQQQQQEFHHQDFQQQQQQQQFYHDASPNNGSNHKSNGRARPPTLPSQHNDQGGFHQNLSTSYSEPYVNQSQPSESFSLSNQQSDDTYNQQRLVGGVSGSGSSNANHFYLGSETDRSTDRSQSQGMTQSQASQTNTDGMYSLPGRNDSMSYQQQLPQAQYQQQQQRHQMQQQMHPSPQQQHPQEQQQQPSMHYHQPPSGSGNPNYSAQRRAQQQVHQSQYHQHPPQQQPHYHQSQLNQQPMTEPEPAGILDGSRRRDGTPTRRPNQYTISPANSSSKGGESSGAGFISERSHYFETVGRDSSQNNGRSPSKGRARAGQDRVRMMFG